MQENHKRFLEEILSKFQVQCSELVHITEASGRVLSADVRAKYTSPYNDMSAINGYAMISDDGSSGQGMFKIIGESKAGHPFTEQLNNGQVVKVYAGAIVPIGADTVISTFDADEKDDQIIIKNVVMKGQNICHRGVDFARDEPVLKAGYIITPRDIGLAASMRVSWVPVRRKPHIAVFAVGDELALIGDEHNSGKVTSSSSLIISSFISGCGAIPLNLGIATDNEISVNRMMEYAKGVDLIITTGGVSASADDLLKKTLDKDAEQIQTTIKLSSLATVMLGEKNGIPVLALPGSPISADICATLFLLPILNEMTDTRKQFFKHFNAILDRDLDINDLQMDYIFAKLIEGDDKRLRALPASSYDRLLMSALAEADCIISVNKDNCKKGDTVSMRRFVCSVASG